MEKEAIKNRLTLLQNILEAITYNTHTKKMVIHNIQYKSWTIEPCQPQGYTPFFRARKNQSQVYLGTNNLAKLLQKLEQLK